MAVATVSDDVKIEKKSYIDNKILWGALGKLQVFEEKILIY